jgi:hypothetical protein
MVTGRSAKLMLQRRDSVTLGTQEGYSSLVVNEVPVPSSDFFYGGWRNLFSRIWSQKAIASIKLSICTATCRPRFLSSQACYRILSKVSSEKSQDAYLRRAVPQGNESDILSGRPLDACHDLIQTYHASHSHVQQDGASLTRSGRLSLVFDDHSCIKGNAYTSYRSQPYNLLPSVHRCP